jgi:hypothetical protein
MQLLGTSVVVVVVEAALKCSCYVLCVAVKPKLADVRLLEAGVVVMILYLEVGSRIKVEEQLNHY